jgi:hypothetical protein
MNRNLILSMAMLGASLGVCAQTAATTVQRDVNQQERIEQGLKSGALSTSEAARLEREQSAISRQQSRALADGKLTPAEQARLRASQNKASRDIRAAKTNEVTEDPQSASSQRLQADVQRNINQGKRIEAGVQNGSLTNHEVAKLERGQARVEGNEARAGRDGHVSAAEQARVQHTENRQSRRIRHEKHDAQVRNPG